MGHVEGKGLGRKGEGRVEIVESSLHKGRRGLGMTLRGFEESGAEWNFEKEKVRLAFLVSQRIFLLLIFATINCYLLFYMPNLYSRLFV